MTKLIPVPVSIHLGIPNGTEVNAEPKIFGFFDVAPYASAHDEYLDVSEWVILEHGEPVEFYDKLLFSVLPRKLLNHVCKTTFETERPFIQMVMIIADETWTFQMRARELEEDEVHYQIKLDDEWESLVNVYVGDVINEEMLAIAEREVNSNMDFGHEDSVLEMMR